MMARCRVGWMSLRALFSLLLFALPGCGVAHDVIDLPGDAVRAVSPGSPKKAPDPAELQQNLLRFTDEFQSTLILAFDRMDKVDPRISLHWRIALASATTSIASGAHPMANLLDMTVFVTLGRYAVEQHWQPKVFGEPGKPLLEAFRAGEAEIWRLAGAVLKPEEALEFRKAVEAWHRDHPSPDSLLAARAMGFASEVATAWPETAKTRGLLDVLKLDPLSGLDPAIREITQARLFAERALFVTQRLPRLLRWQAELTGLDLLDAPAIRQLERAAVAAEKLPDRISREREELVKALEAQERNLRPLVAEARQTLEAGTKMSDSLNVTLKSFDATMKRLGVGEPVPPGTPPGEPFRIQDYARAAERLEAAAKQGTELLAAFDRTLGSENLSNLSKQVAPAVERAELGGRELLDHALKRALLLVVAILLAAIAYRLAAARIAKPPRPG